MQKKSLLLILTFCVSLPIFAQSESGNVRKGNKLYHKEQYEEAQTEFQKGAEKNEKSFSANYNLGNAFFRQQKYKEAIDAYTKAISETQDKKQIAKAFHNVGNALLASEQYEQSVNAYKQSLKLNPKDDETRYNLAVAQHFLQKQQQEQQQNQQDEDENSIMKRAKELVAQRKYQEAYDLIKSNEKKYPELKQHADFTERILNVIKINQ